MKIKLSDLDKRCEMLKKHHKNICIHPGCGKPADAIQTGIDTSCPYHRLLHDYYLYEVDGGKSHYNRPEGLSKEEYRKKHNAWIDEIGKESADGIVLMMAADPINWAC